MYFTIRRFIATMTGIAALTASATSFACSLVPSDPDRITQMMAREIAHRLGMTAAQVPLSAISPPKLHTPYPLGADCSGLGAFHHSAGFRWSDTRRPGPGPMPLPDKPTPIESAAAVGRLPPGSAALRPAPQQCTYEGVAVVMGFDYSSPVAVNFSRRCRGSPGE